MQEMEMLTIKEAVELVGVSRQTIYNWIKEGVLGYVQKGYFRLFYADALLSAAEIMKKRNKSGRPRKGETGFHFVGNL